MKLGNVLAFSIVLGLLCVVAVSAQETATGFAADPEGEPCFCVSEEGTDADTCVNDVLCSGAVQCASTADCAAGETCWRGDNCCGFAICAPTCAPGIVCENPAGTCGTYEPCIAGGVPTLGQWGLVTLAGILGLIALTVIWRRNSFWTAASFVLLVLAVSLGAYSIGSVRDTLGTCQSTGEGELAASLFLGE